MSGIAAALAVAVAGAAPAELPALGENVGGVGLGHYGGRTAIAVSVV